MAANLSLDEFVFVGFNGRVSALDRRSGQIVWSWKAPRGRFSSFVSMLLDGDRLVVSAHGYTYCLDASTGQEIWSQEFKGFGFGHASLASVRGSSSPAAAVATQSQQQSHGAAGLTAGS